MLRPVRVVEQLFSISLFMKQRALRHSAGHIQSQFDSGWTVARFDL